MKKVKLNKIRVKHFEKAIKETCAACQCVMVWLYENMDEPPISEELYEEADIENAFEEDRPSW